MNGKEIKAGETYFFVATDSPARKHLEGTEFTVFEIKHVWRRNKKQSRQVKRFFNEFGEGARAEELEPLDWKPKLGEAMAAISDHWFEGVKEGEIKYIDIRALGTIAEHEKGHPATISESDYIDSDDLPF